jgi:GDP-L-fucose synthase
MNILVTGTNGLLGSAIKRMVEEGPPFYKVLNIYNFIFVSKDEIDLTNKTEVSYMFERINPDVVINTAGRVGGIGRNLNSPAQQFYDNTLINMNVIHAAYEYKIKKLISFSSTCAFPAKLDLFTEDNLHDGEPYPAHRAYAYSKRMVDIQTEAYKKQYGLNACTVIPCNIFGENDNYNLEDAHVIPSLIHKSYLANKNNTDFEVWGDGSPYREFIYANDLARICLQLSYLETLPIRLVVSGPEYQIKDIANMINTNMYNKPIKWLTDKPNGQLRRTSSKILFDSIFPNFQFTDMNTAIKNSCNWFINNYDKARK